MFGSSDGGGWFWGFDEVNVENWKVLMWLVGYVVGMRLLYFFFYLVFSINVVF